VNGVFNTSFEVSLRMLIILNTVQTRLSIDRITALDFIAIYGKDFGVSEYNLHGDNDYRFSEYTSKREIVSQAIKELVLRGYITPFSEIKQGHSANGRIPITKKGSTQVHYLNTSLFLLIHFITSLSAGNIRSCFIRLPPYWKELNFILALPGFCKCGCCIL
jgi:hypothetical protein